MAWAGVSSIYLATAVLVALAAGLTLKLRASSQHSGAGTDL